MAPDHVDHGRAAALERHRQDVDLGGELEQFAGEMLEAADAGMGILQLAGLFLGHIDKLLHRLHRQVRMHREYGRAGAKNRDRRERLDGVVRQLVEPRVDRMCQRDDPDGVAVMW